MPNATPSKKPAAKPAGKPGAPGAKAPKKADWSGAQPGGQPGDEWGEDNPGNQHGIGVDDHVFFHRDGAGPHSGKVVAHGVHGCQVDDAGGQRHKVRWSRMLGVKQKAVLPAQVVERGDAGAILQHPDGRRVFVAGELPLPADAAKFSDVAGLEDQGRKPRRPKVSDLEEFARSAGDLAKSLYADDHECEGPALCRVCGALARQADVEPAPMVKSFSLSDVDVLEALVARIGRR